MIRHGVIGCGLMGRNHIRAATQIEGVRLAGVYDVVASTTSEVAAEFEAIAYDDLDRLIDGVDSVSICTPTEGHASAALAAIAKRRHVFVEKPLAITDGEAETIVEAARAAPVVGAVGHLERFNPAYEALTQALKATAERPISVVSRRVGSIPARARTTGALLELGVHDLDLLLDLFGEPIESIVLLQPGPHGYDVQSLVSLRFAETFATVESSRRYADQARTMTLYFASESWSIDFKNQVFTGPGGYSEGLERRDQVHAELVDFFDAIKVGREPRVTLEDGLRVLRVVQGSRSTANHE